MRHFELQEIVDRYDRGRPRLHELALKAFTNAIDFKRKWNIVLDVACGTGHSSAPLLDFSDSVVGIDVSASMVEIAKKNHPGIEFYVCSAERLPIELGMFDAIFIANGFHWIRKDEFLASIRSSLIGNGWLVIYGLGAPIAMLGNPNYEAWYRNDYWNKFPKPKTLGGSLSQFVIDSGGLLGCHSSISIVHNIELTCSELHSMITTQSNIHQAIESGFSTMADVDLFLNSALPNFFSNTKELFPFNIQIEFAKRL